MDSFTSPRRRILVAEDNPVNQRVAVRMLDKLGYVADVAADGREAVRMAQDTRYAAILMDCHMPDVDGYEPHDGSGGPVESSAAHPSWQ